MGEMREAEAATAAPSSALPVARLRIKKHPADVDAVERVSKQIGLEAVGQVCYCRVA